MVEINIDELIEKMDKFLDRYNIDLKDKYFISKKMSDNYIEDIFNSDEDEDEDNDDEFGDLPDYVPNQNPRDYDTLDDDNPKPDGKLLKKAPKLKK